MVADTTNISIRMDKKLKKEAEELFSQLGMNMSTAFNIFVRQSIRERAIPFTISLDEKPNAETIDAMMESARLLHDHDARTFGSVDELFEDLNDE